MTAALLAALETLAGPGISVAAEPVSGVDGLIGDEMEAVRKAVAKRRAEFAAGRRAARRALEMPHAEIPVGPDRSPVWPDGVVGSISHDTGLAAAAVARIGTIRAIGLDLTEAAPLPGRTSEAILTEAERQLQGLDARLVFSAKESLFKALYPEVGGFFGFDAAVVSPILSEGCFEIRLTRDLGGSPSGTVYTGRAAHADGVLVTLLAL